MFKFMIAGRRHAGFTRLEFSRYYQRVHGGKVLADPDNYVDRYTQNHVIDCCNALQDDGSQLPEVDGVSELWFADAATMQRATSTPHYKSVIQPDETVFTDAARVIVVACAEEEQDVSSPRNGRLKAMRYLRRRAGVTQQAFFEAWRAETARLAAHPVLASRICRLVRNHALPGGEKEVDESFVRGAAINVYDGIESIWFDGAADTDLVSAYRAAVAEEASLIAGLLDPRADLFVVAEERQILPLIRTTGI
ncbi:EthD domain-containing protein [Sphingobium sp. HBC34]|uniref:EthD domain-containing protein n=1 Tax=Sphingobium cyanobacteriorum TaxID=3063954 RepID=A0ABT8ZRZ8_9SPHN|nr:EthD domain-containing protein [Sphingobium sp. HBC34]MDO7837312.1 EthD domain-containing protein [Sphingobium sp. HBC34]